MRITSKLTKTFLTLCTGAALAVAQTPATSPHTDADSSTKNTGPVSKHAGHNEDHGMSSNKGAGLMVGPVDQQFLVKAAQDGMMEVESARMAQEKATSSEIKEFARQLEQDHAAANEKLKALAAQKNVDLPTDMGQHRAMLDKVAAKSGDEFDKQWMKMQVQNHKKDVKEFQKQTDRAMDSDVRSFASSTLPKLQEHLQQAQQLEGSTRGRKASSSDSKMPARSDSAAPKAPSSSAAPQSSDSPTTPAQTTPIN